jgi:hypothetical protein
MKVTSKPLQSEMQAGSKADLSRFHLTSIRLAKQMALGADLHRGDQVRPRPDLILKRDAKHIDRASKRFASRMHR